MSSVSLARKSESRVQLLGVEIDRLDMAGTLDVVTGFIGSRAMCQHVVVNAAKLVDVQRNPRLAQIIRDCPIVNADGQPVVWASRFLGDSLPERVAGIDLMMALLERAAAQGWRVYFLGARESVVMETVARCQQKFPGLIVVGCRDGYFSVDQNAAVVQAVAESQADILFVAMGSPQKEYWIADNIKALNVPFCMGVGGSFDVVSGLVRRAPRWAQRAGLEWLYRFLQEPRRLWRRYLHTNSAFVCLVFREWIARHLVSDQTNGREE